MSSTIERSSASTLARRVAPPGPATAPGAATQENRSCCDVHCNSLWSIWYGIIALALQSFIVYHAVQRFLTYLALPWPEGQQPYLELNLFVGLVGAGVVLQPFFLVAFAFKIGNLANDGHKLGKGVSACSVDPPSAVAPIGEGGGLIRNAWHHGGPTAAFIHLVSAFCFILPKVFIEAKLIDVGFLTQDRIWSTDIDWLVPHHDRLVILQFLTGGAVNATSATTQAPFHHPAAQIRDYLEKQEPWFPVSPEFVNYALALIVFSVRYPAVFWNTNKAFAFIFSVQLFANSIQNLIAIGGLSVMYKVQMLGPQNVLHRYEPFLLNPSVCVLLYVLSLAVTCVSSCVLYMYGHHKLAAFLERASDRHHIRLVGTSSALWSHFPHCAAFCALIALAVCQAPLLHDFVLVYKGSLDGTVLAHVCATVLHLFCWVAVWLVLTAKQSWQFKLGVVVGRAVVTNARSIKLLSQVDLQGDDEDAGMMIVAFGKAFTVAEAAPKRLIMQTLARAAIERDKAMEEEDQNCQETQRLLTNEESQQVNMSPRPFRSVESNSASPRRGAEAMVPDDTVSPVSVASSPPPQQEIDGGSHVASSPQLRQEDTDDELPPPPGHCESNNDSGNSSVVTANVTAGCNNHLSPNAAHPNFVASNKRAAALMQNHEVQDVQTPRSNRSVDSGLPHDDLTPRSDSISTSSSSASPPDQQQLQQQQREQHQKSNSMDEIVQQQQQWQSSSLQRGVQQPANEAIYGELGTVAIRRKPPPPALAAAAAADDEDPYGRCLNMRLTSFNDAAKNGGDPRIIDLSSTTASSSSVASTNTVVPTPPRQASPVMMMMMPQQFNTLPAAQTNNINQQPSIGRGTPAMAAAAAHNTLPARVNGAIMPPGNTRGSFQGPTGRHFKPFDHRRINLMAEIQEHPSPQQAGTDAKAQSVYANTQLIVQKTPHLAHMPAELRHTNYSSTSSNGPRKLANPQVLEHQRDSANFSLTSSDSGL